MHQRHMHRHEFGGIASHASVRKDCKGYRVPGGYLHEPVVWEYGRVACCMPVLWEIDVDQVLCEGLQEFSQSVCRSQSLLCNLHCILQGAHTSLTA